MAGAIFLVREDGELVSLQEEGYVSEDQLQELLATHPELLAGELIDPENPRRWLLIGREFGVPGEEGAGNRWSIDHLFLDQDGVPTLVEVKRSSDTRIRREVVGQLIDYAANGVVYWPPERLEETFVARCEAAGLKPEEVLSEILDENDSYEAFWERTRTNLHVGRVRLLFVADHIPAELRRVVEFLNEQMSPAEVAAIELRQYAGEGLQTLVPRVHGITAGSERTKNQRRSRRKWNEDSFFAELAKNAEPGAVDGARRILDWATRSGLEVWWGEGRAEGSFSPRIHHNGTKHQLFAVWTYGALEMYFVWYARKAPFDDDARRQEIVDRLTCIPGVDLPADAIHRRPSIPLEVLSDETALREVLDVLDGIVAAIRAS